MKFSKIVLSGILIAAVVGGDICAKTWQEVGDAANGMQRFYEQACTAVRSAKCESLDRVASDLTAIVSAIPAEHTAYEGIYGSYTMLTSGYTFDAKSTNFRALCDALDGLTRTLTAKYTLADKPAADKAVMTLVVARVPEAIDALVLKLNNQFVLVFVTPTQLETAKSGILSAFFTATKGLADVAVKLRQEEAAVRAAGEERRLNAEREEGLSLMAKNATDIRTRLTDLKKEVLILEYTSWWPELRKAWLFIGFKKYGKPVSELLKLRAELMDLASRLTPDKVGAAAVEALNAIRLSVLARINESLKSYDDLVAVGKKIDELERKYTPVA